LLRLPATVFFQLFKGFDLVSVFGRLVPAIVPQDALPGIQLDGLREELGVLCGDVVKAFDEAPDNIRARLIFRPVRCAVLPNQFFDCVPI
jgi:hypothetical protein